MPTLSTELRKMLERTCVAARNLAEPAAKAALEAVAVQNHQPYGHMSKEQKDLRNRLRAQGRQIGDVQDSKGQLSIKHLTEKCAYEHWHRMLFARFLAENNLLIEPDLRVAVSLEECKELAKEAKTDLWTLAGRFAQKMLPEVFRADSPVLQVTLAREDQLKLEQLLDSLPADVFTASDSLGWCYQFWQTERKEEVNKGGNKIGADELPVVTQLFTEDYMVDFLLDNTLGAWWAGKKLITEDARDAEFGTEEDVRRFCSLPDVPWKYLRFLKSEDGKWTPAAGTFDGWPKAAKNLKCLDPCMGSGHFVVAMFERLVALRMVEENLDENAVVAAVIRDNLFGLEIDPRCTQIAAFNLALAAWRRLGYCKLPDMNLACSGLAPNTKKDDWMRLAEGHANLRFAMGALYELFQKAPLLGSLIDPARDKAVTYGIQLHDLRPFLDITLKQENDDEAHELAVRAKGITTAAEIMSSHFTLVATNVPYLFKSKQRPELKSFCESYAKDAAADLATVFVERCSRFCAPGGSHATVTPQNWFFLKSYSKLRRRLLTQQQICHATAVGSGATAKASWDVLRGLVIATTTTLLDEYPVTGIETDAADGNNRANDLAASPLLCASSKILIQNPNSRLALSAATAAMNLLQRYADSLQGISTGDNPRHQLYFWEVSNFQDIWGFQQGPVPNTILYGGREKVIRWENGEGSMASADGSAIRGLRAVGHRGVAITQMRGLPATVFSGSFFDTNVAVVLPKDDEYFPAIWSCCSSPAFLDEVRRVDKKINVTNATFGHIPFDFGHWQKVAAEKYPNGLPKSFSSDPTQWLFNGHPKGSDEPLQVAVARLLGYQWPRQTGSSFPDCPALGLDGLEKLADDDGIVCIPSVRGAEPAAERLRKMLVAAYGTDWKDSTELELIRATGSKASDLDEWLRNEFFEQQCDLFHQRPLIWHIWDGRKRDGFHALVSCHKLVDGDNGRKLLESLTFAYLGEWITRQRDGEKRGEVGAEERLAAALELQQRLQAMIEGEPPFDIFVRWKPLREQAIGWEPDINDGVRMNIRPFLVSDLPNGKKGAGILRSRPNIKWEKDRGKEPQRDKNDFPWFWKDGKFTGDRVNDVHLKNDVKRKARN